MSWIHQPLRANGSRPLQPPRVACDGCSATLFATEAHVVPALSAYSNVYTATHRCSACRMMALVKVREALDAAGPREILTLVAVIERHGVAIPDARHRPLPKAREAIRRVLDRLATGEVQLAVPVDPERHEIAS